MCCFLPRSGMYREKGQWGTRCHQRLANILWAWTAEQVICSEGSTLLPDFIFMGPVLIISEPFHIVRDSSRKENGWNSSLLLGCYSDYMTEIKPCWLKFGFAFHECVIPLCCVKSRIASCAVFSCTLWMWNSTMIAALYYYCHPTVIRREVELRVSQVKKWFLLQLKHFL